MKTLICFNAPPNSGKDVSADYLADKYDLPHLRFKNEVYWEAAMEAEITIEQMKELAIDRSTKDSPDILFGGLSPRQWLIHVSEELIKPEFGKDYFGHKLADELQDGITVCSDSGFPDELIPVINTADIVYVVRIHRDGCSFDNDSRNYLSDEFLTEHGAYFCDISNNESLTSLYDKLECIYQDVFELELQLANKEKL